MVFSGPWASKRLQERHEGFCFVAGQFEVASSNELHRPPHDYLFWNSRSNHH